MMEVHQLIPTGASAAPASRQLSEKFMETKVNEISDGIYRFSTFVPEIAPPAGFSRLIPPERLRWITFGHYEADECGAMNEWLAVAPQAEVAHGQTGCLVSLNDMADRAPRVLQNDEVVDLGKGRRVRYFDTPHIPHGWEAGVLYEERTGTLLCGDLLTQLGDGPALTEADIVGPAIVAEDMFKYSSPQP
jgi:flavorubredoxin